LVQPADMMEHPATGFHVVSVHSIVVSAMTRSLLPESLFEKKVSGISGL